MNKAVRVRFAPSPTGPLHIGGVRTALYNYLFAKKMGGAFILRVEDTDQTRYVEGAEEYILESLAWLGLQPDESVRHGGDYGPYRQSERKDIYQKHVQQLIEKGHAYYAFDTPEELDEMRKSDPHGAKYDAMHRMKMRNSLTLSADEVTHLLEEGVPATVRMKVPQGEVIQFQDIVRGTVSFDSSELDDKVILKADGLPTYHLANIVDDYLMKISHVIRGEEWLSSTAHHVLLYRFFGWENEMPRLAHLPLLMKPTGKGKLSKRDGAKFGFPVFPLDWNGSEEKYEGFREAGFLPAALINFLALLGWNPGDDQEMFTVDELCEVFDLEKIVKSGAKFNYEKAKWFNQQYIIATPTEDLVKLLLPYVEKAQSQPIDRDYCMQVVEVMKPRIETLDDFYEQSKYFWQAPSTYDEKPLKKKYKPENQSHFEAIIALVEEIGVDHKSSIEQGVKGYIKDNKLSFGQILPILRIWMTGSMTGPDLFDMMCIMGKQETIRRLTQGLKAAA